MANIIIIDNDDRVVREMRQYLNELDDGHRIISFETIDEFEKIYFVDPDEKKEEEKSGDDGEVQELSLVSTVDLVIVRAEIVKNKTIREWIEDSIEVLKEKGFFPIENTTRFIITKYEDDGLEKLDLLDANIDDLVYFPLDRPLFITKVEIALSLPKKIKPSFLFYQNCKIDIEISKLSYIDFVSEIGFAIRNPVPLVEGLLVHFLFRLPGREELIDIYARTLNSEPHPDFPGLYLVYFNFFGVPSKNLLPIRQYLASQPSYQQVINPDREDFKFNEDNMFISEEEKKIKNVAILDMDEGMAATIESSLTENIDRVQVVRENSYHVFVMKYLETEFAAEKFMAQVAASELDFYVDTVSWTIDVDSQDLLICMSRAKENDFLFGHLASEFFETPQAWKNIFNTETTSQVVEETIQVVSQTNQKVKRRLDIKDTDGNLKFISAMFTLAKNKKSIQIDLFPPKEVDTSAGRTEAKLTSLDMVIVDRSMLPENFSAWYEHISRLAKSKGLILPSASLKVLIISEAKLNSTPLDFDHPHVIGYCFKPVELKTLCFHVTWSVKAHYSMYRFDNLFWYKTKMSAHLGKESKLTGISEFGGSLSLSRPIGPGSFLFLHKSIFHNAPGHYLCARFYHNEEPSETNGPWKCSFVYWGITDAFLKYCRSWIRENYAQEKEAQQG